MHDEIGDADAYETQFELEKKGINHRWLKKYIRILFSVFQNVTVSMSATEHVHAIEWAHVCFIILGHSCFMNN